MGTLRTVIGSVLAGLICCAGVGAQQFDEYGVKSAFVFSFLPFIEWPASKLGPADPLTLCILDEHPIAAKLSSLDGRTVREHPIRVRTIGAIQDAASCHVLFVGAQNADRTQELTARQRRSGLLVIGEEAAALGSAIGLSVDERRVVFDVDLHIATDQGLTFSSKLLRLARRVSGAARSNDLHRQPEGM